MHGIDDFVVIDLISREGVEELGDRLGGVEPVVVARLGVENGHEGAVEGVLLEVSPDDGEAGIEQAAELRRSCFEGFEFDDVLAGFLLVGDLCH